MQASKDGLAGRALRDEITERLQEGCYLAPTPLLPGRCPRGGLCGKGARAPAPREGTRTAHLRRRTAGPATVSRSNPQPFVRQALAKANRLKLVETLHNQPVGHFALNALDWRLLAELGEECELTVAPAVTEAVEKVTGEAVREVIPLYEVARKCASATSPISTRSGASKATLTADSQRARPTH